MLRALVTLSSFALGGTAVAAVLYMQNTPLAFAEPPGSADEWADSAVELRVPELPQRLAVRHDGTQVPERRARAALRRRAVADVIAARPCSDWRSLGPKAVAIGAEPSHNVRLLCE
jgi:hypothetical protein